MIGKNKPISILFIGNSFSYYHSLPKLIAHFARASDCGNLVVDGVFRGGATLKMLWHDGRTLKKLRSRTWDYVVLQERGRLGGIVKDGIVHVGRPQVFFTYATRFDKAIKGTNAKTILYCPPAFLGIGLPGDAEKLNAAYAMLARKLHALMIPSGIAFALVSKRRPHMNLYEHDGHHPNPLGTYLIASLFYRKLFHKKASNLPLESYLSRSERLPKNPKTIKLSGVDARFLWSVANRIK
jgi:hypothetical protein